MSWGDGYAFSSGLPQPSLSTGAVKRICSDSSMTQLPATWLLAAFVNGFS